MTKLDLFPHLVLSSSPVQLCCHAQFSSGTQVRTPSPNYTSEIKGLKTAGFLLKKYTGKSSPSRFVQSDQICLESTEVNRSSLLQVQYSSRFCNQFSAVLKRSIASITVTQTGTNTHLSHCITSHMPKCQYNWGVVSKMDLHSSKSVAEVKFNKQSYK